MKKVIITGASGFIGKALTKHLLDQNIEVYAIVRDPQKLSDLSTYSNLKIITCEMSEYSSLVDKITERDFDVCFYCAWEGTFGESFKDYHLQLNNSAYAGDNLMAMISLKCKKFIFCSTLVELEVKKHVQLEKSEPRISCIYGTAKLAATMLCKTLAYNYGIEFNTVIIASVYGEGDYSKMIQNILMNSLINNKEMKLIEGNNLYDWIYIQDLVRGLQSVGEKGIDFKSYYLGHREFKTFKEIVLEVKNILNPEGVLKFGEYPDGTPVDYSLIDTHALYNDTGFECKADFRDSILKTAEWVKTLNF